MKIFPKKIDFFDLLEKAAVNATRSTKVLVRIMTDFNDLDGKVKELYEVEQEGDILTHDIMRKLNQTFLTPIDREDIQALASSIDDIVDLIWAGVDKMRIIKIAEPTPDALQLAKDLDLTTESVLKAVMALRAKDYSRVKDHCIEINRLENLVDRTFRATLGRLFETHADNPLLVMKWKDIYEHLEDSADKCEDVANIIESIVLKHA